LTTGGASADEGDFDGSATGLADSDENGDVNSAAATELKSSMDEVEDSIDYVKRMITQQMDLISKHKADEVDGDVMKKREDEAAEKKKSEEAQKSEEAHKKEIADRQNMGKRRQEIDNCLSMIRGGTDKLYFSLKKLFAKTPTDSVCAVLKAFEFPNFARHGFHESFYKGEQPNMNGSNALYFKAAKSHIWACMCEFSSTAVAAQAVQVAVDDAQDVVQA